MLQFTVSAPSGQMFSIQTSPAYPGASLDYVYATGDNGDPGPLLNVVTIPEPGAASMLGIMAFAGLMMRRRTPGT